MRIYVVGLSKVPPRGGGIPQNFWYMYMCDPPPNSGAVKITKNGGVKILGCLKMGAENYVLVMIPFLRDVKEF